MLCFHYFAPFLSVTSSVLQTWLGLCLRSALLSSASAAALPLLIHLQAGRLLANSSKSCTVATPRTKRLLRSVTTAKSCFPLSSDPRMKNSSSSSSGVSIVMTLYVPAFRLNLTIAADTGSLSFTFPSLSNSFSLGMDKYPIKARVSLETTVRCV